MTKAKCVAMVGTMLMAAPACAQDLPATRAQLDLAIGQYFVGADRNGDGKLDRAETATMLGVARKMLARRERAFFSLETGPDGRPQLSIDQGGMLNALYRGIDRNRDDRLSLAEVRAAARARFDAADANHDGRLDKAEMVAAKQQLSSLHQAIQAAR